MKCEVFHLPPLPSSLSSSLAFVFIFLVLWLSWVEFYVWMWETKATAYVVCGSCSARSDVQRLLRNSSTLGWRLWLRLGEWLHCRFLLLGVHGLHGWRPRMAPAKGEPWEVHLGLGLNPNTPSFIQHLPAPRVSEPHSGPTSRLPASTPLML